MIRSLLIRGMLVGAVAGVLAFVFALIFGEPQVQHAIDFEEALSRAAHEPEEAALVSRGVQRGSGLLVGMVVMGVALGGIFSLVFAWCYGRLGSFGARTTSALLALAAFLTITLIPFTKYPSNPPAVSADDTISKRTWLYFAMIAISVLAFIAAGRIRRAALERTGAWNATILAGVGLVAIIAVAQLILPAVHETPATFPPEVLYRFRLASLGINGLLWVGIGLGFGAAAERVLAATAPRRTTAPVTA
jgi:predicted cobalt transporter CbtA